MANPANGGPPARALIRRGRLERRLDSGPPVVAVVGAAGTGKTTLVRSWFEARDHTTRAWVDLGRLGAGDAITLGRTLLDAAARLGVTDPDALVDLLPGDGTRLGQDFVGELATGLRATAEPWELVIENLHSLDPVLAGEVGALVAAAVVAPHRVVVTSRQPVPDVAAPGRPVDRAAIVTGEDLAFTAPEVKRLLGRGTKPALVDELMTLTRGWTAAVEAARWHLVGRRALDAGSLLPDLVGFVTREVLPDLDEVEERVLCRVSVLPVAPVAVAVAVAEEPGAGAVLRSVASRTTLLKEVARDELEIHPLLREALRRRLDELEPGGEVVRHRLAAPAWLAQSEGLDGVLHAMDHLIAGHAWDEALDLIVRTWSIVYVQHRTDLHVSWLDRIPGHHWEDRPVPVIVYLMAAVTVGRVDRGVDRVSGLPVAGPALPPLIKLARAYAVWWTTPPREALRLATEAMTEVAQLPADVEVPLPPMFARVEQYDTIAAMSQGRAHLLLGELDRATQVFRGLHDDDRSVPVTRVTSRSVLVFLASLRGEVDDAEAEARSVLRASADLDFTRVLGISLAPLALAVCAYLRGDLDDALAAVDRSAQQGRALAAPHHLQVCQLVAALCGEPGRVLGDETTPAVPLLPFVDRFLVTAEARSRGRAGDVAGAYDTLAAIEPDPRVISAWTEVSIESRGAEMTARWLATRPPPSTPWDGLVRALSEAAVATGAERRRRLDDAGSVLAIHPLVGVLADAPGQLLDSADVHPVLRRARAARDGREAARGPRLTPRELELVGLLDGPAQVAELAELLYVSPGTVKTHLRAIYRKLGVGNRADAVARALDLGLLTRRPRRT